MDGHLSGIGREFQGSFAPERPGKKVIPGKSSQMVALTHLSGGCLIEGDVAVGASVITIKVLIMVSLLTNNLNYYQRNILSNVK